MFGTVDELVRDGVQNRSIAAAVPVRKKLFYFCSEVSDATTLKRIQQFIDYGFDITVFGFHRTRYNTGHQPAWPYVPLGLTVDGRYWHRLRAMVGALPAIIANRRRLKGSGLFYARNLDQLILALFARLISFSRAPIVYEVLDIPPFLASRGAGPMLFRWIERLCLHGVRLLVLSSPAFHRQYYATTQKYRGPWFLLENKLHPSITTIDRPNADTSADTTAETTTRERGSPWIVGYFGLIRGQGTFDLMTRLAERLQGRVHFKFRGALTTVDPASFHTALAQLPNMEFGGPYVPHKDLEELYSSVDFAWALDLEHTDHNSRWLMPCRFYESGYFGVPCLAVRSFEVGSVLERHHIGFTFERPLEEQLVHFFETLTVADYEHIRARLRAVPREMFVADDDATRLCSMMEGLTQQPEQQLQRG